MADDLKERVDLFYALKLPGQPLSMHMGTNYLVGDLWREYKHLNAENARLRAELAEQRKVARRNLEKCDRLRALLAAPPKEVADALHAAMKLGEYGYPTTCQRLYSVIERLARSAQEDKEEIASLKRTLDACYDDVMDGAQGEAALLPGLRLAAERMQEHSDHAEMEATKFDGIGEPSLQPNVDFWEAKAKAFAEGAAFFRTVISRIERASPRG